MKDRCKKFWRCYGKGQFAAAFGAGLILASFCPMRVTLLLAGCILVLLGLSIPKC